MLFGQIVEGRKHLIQERHDLVRRHFFRQLGEIDDVGEQHGDVGVAVGDGAFFALETLGDGRRQDVEQKFFRACLFDFQRGLAGGFLANKVAHQIINDG